MIRTIFAAALALALLPTFAAAQGLSSQAKTAAYLAAIAHKGYDCGHLAPWEATLLRASVHEDLKRSQADRNLVEQEANRLNESWECDAAAMTVWIEGARKGMELEMLVPYLVIYKTLAGMDEPPLAFTSTALRLDYASAISLIDAKLDEFEASGRPAEGGKPWPEYVERTAGFAEEFAETLKSDGSGADEAASYIAQSALIVEQWLETGQ